MIGRIEDILDKILEGNALDILKTLPDNCIDTCITSPPYYSQRFYGVEANTVWNGDPNCDHQWEVYVRPGNTWSTPGPGLYKVKGEYNKAWIRPQEQAFCKKCGAWYGQLGLEPSPSLYIKHLVQIFREVKRVLKPSGVFFLNIGDSYFGGLNKYAKEDWLRPKQLMLIPSRLAIALQEDGWILRNDIIWYKVNHMPHPVKDRLVSAYEHVFMFVKNRKYFFDLDSIRVPHKWASKDKRSLFWRVEHKTGKSTTGQYASNAVGYHPMGRNPGDVWSMKTANYKGSHFAVFPEELVRRCLKAGCPKEVCIKCGRPKVRKYEVVQRKWEDLTKEEQDFLRRRYGLDKRGKYKGQSTKDFSGEDNPSNRKRRIVQSLLKTRRFVGWVPSCKCNVDFRPGIVLDPFLGSGTTAVVAKELGLFFIGIELNPKYIKLAKNRLRSSITNYLNERNI